MRPTQAVSVVAAAVLVVVGAGCSSLQSERADKPAAPPIDPAQRAVRIETTGCGFASGRTGSGVAVGDGLIVTVAHLVARAEDIFAYFADEQGLSASVTAVDLNRDLALLRVPPNAMPVIEMSSLRDGAKGLIVEGAASGTVPFEVRQVVTLAIEEILGTDRHSRRGYELAAETATGDSGAGAYDEENRLIGIVFATSQEGESSWITSSAEIDDFLTAHGSDVTEIVCDSEESRIDLG